MDPRLAAAGRVTLDRLRPTTRAALDWLRPTTRAALDWLRPTMRGALDWLLPPACAGCRAALRPSRPDGALCARCRGRVAWSGPDERVPVDPALLAGVWAGAWYEGPVEDWLRRFKYPGRGPAALSPAPGAAVETLLLHALALAERGAGPAHPIAAAVVPVPSPRRRIRERGFQPTAVLARAAAARLGLPIDWRALRATGLRPSQTGLSRSARRRNAAGAFAAGAPSHATLLLVDDVVTTGATLESAARVLRARGARRVVAVCAARARLEDAPRPASGGAEPRSAQRGRSPREVP